jgi:hypothetical protein
VIVDDFDIYRAAVGPPKTDSPLIIDPHTMLSGAIALKRLQTIAWRASQVLKSCRGIDHFKLATRDAMDGMKPPAEAVVE